MYALRDLVWVFLAVGTSLLANAAKGACWWRSPSGLWLSRPAL